MTAKKNKNSSHLRPLSTVHGCEEGKKRVITKRQSDGENSPSLSAAVFDIARKECF